MDTAAEFHVSDDPQRILLRVVQVYLQRRLQAEAPGAILTLYWEEFFRIYAPVVAAMVGRHLQASAESEDLVQEIWLTVAAKLPDFRWTENRGGFRAWLSTLIRTRTIDLIRKKTRHRRIEPVDARSQRVNARSESTTATYGMVLEPVDPSADPTARLEQEWQRQAVNAILEDLRPQIGEVNYRIVRLHYWHGQTLAEIAAAVGLSPPQVNSRLHRALEKLRLRAAAYFGT